MTPEAQRIAIAEVCGWKEVRKASCAHGQVSGVWQNEIRNWVPSYLTDLNAMHEAEATLNANSCAVYATQLMKWHPTYCTDVIDERNAAEDFACETFKIIHATAAQRAEAFLRTIEKWEDAK